MISEGKEFEGEIALVTGASRGIGQAVALDLARHGAEVFGTATSAGGAQSIGRMFAGEDLQGHGLVLDIGQREAIQTRLDDIVATVGRPVSLLVNNAGITRNVLTPKMDEEWDDVINVNLSGTFRVTRAVLRGMHQARRGRVVTIGSVIGTIGARGQANYAASKAGLEGMTRSMAKEYANKGITLNVVAPGYVDTEMTQNISPKRRQELLETIPLGRAYTPEEIAECIRETLLSGDTGQVISIDGGLT